MDGPLPKPLFAKTDSDWHNEPMFDQQGTVSRNVQMIIFAVTIVILAVAGYYSVQLYQQTGAEQQGFVICNETTCEKSIHIHADIFARVCGEEIRIPKNVGSVVEQHTHAEQNYMHLHIKYEVDPETHEPLDTTLLQLGNFFENVNISFSSHPATLGSYSVGDTCADGTVLTQEHLIMTVNGEPNTEFENYIWQDGDDIVVQFE